jgi:hypothetical protein
MKYLLLILLIFIFLVVSQCEQTRIINVFIYVISCIIMNIDNKISVTQVKII